MTDIQLLTLGQAAKQLGVSVSTVERLIKKGSLIPIYPTGGKPRLTRLELERFVTSTQRQAWEAEETLQDEIRLIFNPDRGRASTASRNKKVVRVSR
jgi:excisionase family DNA binding protein